jgi:radical SAM peptide maturase (CXXX-repeat target family)
MKFYKFEKEIILYKPEFEKVITDLCGNHTLERLSMDLDSILFHIKYMTKMNLNSELIPELKKEFTSKADELRTTFGLFMNYFFTEIIKYDKFDNNCIIDLLSNDIKIDSSFIRFTAILISKDLEFVEFLESTLKEMPYRISDEFFRYNIDSYNDAIAKAYPELFIEKEQNQIGCGNDRTVFVHSFTFQTSERCSLNCTYCYQFNKSGMRMKFETAKKFIDNLLIDKYSYINKFNSPAIIIEFIGGEPLLEIKLTRQIYEYFLKRCYELNHPWFKFHRVSICSNGLQYFDQDVQDFFKDYSENISFNISIDGSKMLHDMCRIQPNGEGSYDIAIAALKHYTEHYVNERNSKMTLAPSNIKYLFESVVDFIKNGMTVINLNCVFEEGWNQETARTEYQQLKRLAYYIVTNDLDNIYISIFRDRQEDIHEKSYDGNFCGGLGSMLSLRPNGDFYPCIRYMPTSVGSEVKDLKLGSVNDGMIGREEGSKVLKMMDKITRRSQSNDICFNCPIGNNCANCSALGHTVFGTPEKRTTFTCIQMIAEALANVYYWNILNIKHPEYKLGVRKNNVPEEWAKLVLSDEELEQLYEVEIGSMYATWEYIHWEGK